MKKTIVMPRNPEAAAMIAEAMEGIPGVALVDPPPAAAQPRIDVHRYNDRIDVLVNYHRVASREENSGKVTWYPMEGFTESDKGVIERDVLAKVPRQTTLNRAQRRHLARAKRRGKR